MQSKYICHMLKLKVKMDGTDMLHRFSFVFNKGTPIAYLNSTDNCWPTA